MHCVFSSWNFYDQHDRNIITIYKKHALLKKKSMNSIEINEIVFVLYIELIYKLIYKIVVCVYLFSFFLELLPSINV